MLITSSPHISIAPSQYLRTVNDITESLNHKQTCAAVLINLSEAFYTVDQHILRQQLLNVGLSEQAVCWFKNYFSNRTQCAKFDSTFVVKSMSLQGSPKVLSWVLCNTTFILTIWAKTFQMHTFTLMLMTLSLTAVVPS